MMKHINRFLKIIGILDSSFEELISPIIAEQAKNITSKFTEEKDMLFIDFGSNIERVYSFF